MRYQAIKGIEKISMHNTKGKNPICKGHMYDPDDMTSWKKQKHGDNKKISGYQRLGVEEEQITRTQGNFKAMKIPCIF